MRKILLFLTLSLFLSSSSLVYAQNSSGNGNSFMPPKPTLYNEEAKEAREEQREENRELREEAKEDRVELREQAKEAREETRSQRCEGISNRVENYVAMVTKTKEKHTENYANLQTRLYEISSTVAALGADTTDLDAAIAGLEPLIDDVLAQSDVLLAAIQGVEDIDCENLEPGSSTFRDKYSELKTEYQTLKSLRQEVRSYYREEIRPELAAIRQFLVDQAKEDVDSVTESEEN